MFDYHDTHTKAKHIQLSKIDLRKSTEKISFKNVVVSDQLFFDKAAIYQDRLSQYGVQIQDPLTA